MASVLRERSPSIVAVPGSWTRQEPGSHERAAQGRTPFTLCLCTAINDTFETCRRTHTIVRRSTNCILLACSCILLAFCIFIQLYLACTIMHHPSCMWLGVYVDMVPLPLLVAPERWRGPPPNLNEVPPAAGVTRPLVRCLYRDRIYPVVRSEIPARRASPGRRQPRPPG